MEPTQTPRPLRRRLLGALLYLGFLVVVAGASAGLALANRPDHLAHGGGPGGHTGGGEADATQIRLLTPAGAIAGHLLPLDFATAVPLTGGPDGWGARGLHLHAAVNGSEIMSGGARIQALGGNHYRWELPLRPGRYQVELFWASHRHGRIARGASGAVAVTLTAAAPGR